MSGFDADAVTALYDALVSHAAKTSLFPGGVTDHEPMNAPTGAVSAAIMLGPLGPTRGSGQAATSGRLEFHCRIYVPRQQLPAGGADRVLLKAVAPLLAAYSDDFELITGTVPEGLIWGVDLLGAFGAPMSMTPGWLNQDGAPFRVGDVLLPVIINDMWGQSA